MSNVTLWSRPAWDTDRWLPANITSDAVSASYDAGVLTVRVAGAYAGAQAQRIAITK